MFKIKHLIYLFVLLLFSGCASINQNLTPGTQTIISGFDNSIEVIQKPVSAANGLDESRNILGFRWNNTDPSVVYLIAGTKGTVNISGLAFNIDGEIYNVGLAGKSTKYGQYSIRQFKVPFNVFQKIAAAKVVKMKITLDKYNVYSFGNNRVSSFGTDRQNAIVSGKFADFQNQINKIR